MIAIVFWMSKPAVWESYHRVEDGEHALASAQVIQKAARTPNSLLLPEEERVIVWTGQHQRQGDCPSPRAVRDFAGCLFKRRTPHERIFTRDSWRGFHKRQSEKLLVSVGAAKEAQRTEVTRGSVLAYFAELGNILPACVMPNQIMNMDETGLSVRPMKGKTRKLVSLKSCALRPTFHEEKDVSHVSLVATVNLGGPALTPLILTTTGLPFKSEELAILRWTFAVYRTARGYMTVASMMFYLNHIGAPYVMFLRVMRQDLALMVYLVMDNHGTHSTPDVLQEMTRLGIQPIWLPAHTSHFPQPLDLTVFSAFKRTYMNTWLVATRPKIERKIVRALRAWHTSAYTGFIYNGWKAGELQVRGPLSNDAIPELNSKKSRSSFARTAQMQR
jgi:hypothetical protein